MDTKQAHRICWYGADWDWIEEFTPTYKSHNWFWHIQTLTKWSLR